MHALDLNAVTDLVCNFLVVECCIRKLCPDSVAGVYTHGVVAVLRLNAIPSAELFSSALKAPAVQFITSGLRRLYAKVHPKSEQVKVAFSPAAARHMNSLLSSGQIDNGCRHLSAPLIVLATLRLFACCMFAIPFLLRKSEMLYKEGKAAPPTRSSITFFNAQHHIIPDHLVGSGGVNKAMWLRNNVHAGKADQLGEGRIHLITAQPAGNCTVAIVEAYYCLSRDAGALPSDSLFDCPGLPRLTSNVLARVMKATVTALGLNAARVSTHSLRYGGATALAAAGFPEYIIAMYGGWKEGSQSLRRYIRPSIDIVHSVSAHMYRMSLNAISDDHMAMFLAQAND